MSGMNKETATRDCCARAEEILMELREDGYPPDLQWITSLALVVRIIVRHATDERDLREALKATRGIIEGSSKIGFKRRGRRN